VHGEDGAKQALAEEVRRHGWHAEIPGLGQQVTF